MNVKSQVDLALASGYGTEDHLQQSGKGISHRARLLVLSMVLTLLFVAVPGASGVGVQDVAANHSTAVTVTGQVSGVSQCYPSCRGWVQPYRWTGSSWVAGSFKYTDGYGRFTLTLSRNHTFAFKFGYYLDACHTSYPRLVSYNGTTAFWISGNARVGTLYVSSQNTLPC